MQTLARVCAVWIVALIIAPFSAPFSVGDGSPSLKNATSHALPAARPNPHRQKRTASLCSRSAPSIVPTLTVLTSCKIAPVVVSRTPRVLPLRI